MYKIQDPSLFDHLEMLVRAIENGSYKYQVVDSEEYYELESCCFVNDEQKFSAIQLAANFLIYGDQCFDVEYFLRVGKTYDDPDQCKFFFEPHILDKFDPTVARNNIEFLKRMFLAYTTDDPYLKKHMPETDVCLPVIDDKNSVFLEMCYTALRVHDGSLHLDNDYTLIEIIHMPPVRYYNFGKGKLTPVFDLDALDELFASGTFDPLRNLRIPSGFHIKNEEDLSQWDPCVRMS